MGLFDRLFKKIEYDSSSQQGQFAKVFDNTEIHSERIQLLYRGRIYGRNPKIVYQYTLIRAVLSFRLSQLQKGDPTHEFACMYRDLEGVFRILYLFKFDCRLVGRDPDQVAKQISDFLIRLLIEVSESPGSIRNIIVSQESLDYWSEAFQKRVISLIEMYEKRDSETNIF